MKLAEERGLREATTAIVLGWAENRDPPFRGETRSEFEEAIAAAHVIADEARIGFHRWIDAARRAGMSWAEIGNILGITKQAAQQRFGHASDQDQPADPHLVVRSGATAFNEMGILREEGEKGHELVQTDAFKLVFRPSEQKWEYRRTLGLSPDLPGMEKSGWTHVSSWFPFHYFKRPVAE
jgi:hypothetical protein